MSYIGRSPQIGAYHKLDSITTDGSASYTMQLDSANFVPESVNHLIVSVNGVIQAPTDSFTVSGSTITFASSLSVSDTIDFIMALGNVLDIGTPSDSTVSLSKLTATGTKDATTFLRGDNTFATPSGGENTPAFHAYLSSVQNISNGVVTKVQIDTEVFDSDSCYDNTTNYRFTPTVAGKYFVYGTITIDASSNSSLDFAYAFLYKNGARISQTESAFSDNKIRRISQHTYQVVDMNGTTDYIELFGAQTGGASPAFEGGNTNKDSIFGAFKIIGA